MAFNQASAEIERFGLTDMAEEILFRYFCGELDSSCYKELVAAFVHKFKQQHPTNLSEFVRAFAKRKTLNLELKTPTLAVYGGASPNANQTRRNLARFPCVRPFQIANCTLPLAEAPHQPWR
ncbi:uncharacterized protein LOC100904094 isoform X2 [Galendromus occidentalis]|uniref:Uncharacterized protein LOC100904094 isoform X2 n=1 Tax=Galendromus occidentalis TaxID=34638 RepID=A0AAJ7L6K2_9ACAR|nr:uncharacterized protein LOC100904094 isoform X2 [Galendromus occidentalis]